MNTTAIAAVVVSAMMHTPAAHAAPGSWLQLEMAIGGTRYAAQGDNVWYQQGMPHALRLNAPMWSLGLTGPIYRTASWGVDWHVDYVNLGNASSDCTCTPVDANYDVANHRKLNLYDAPDAHYHGNGRAQGIALTLEPYVLYRGWRVGVEGGLFPYRPAWEEDVTGWSWTAAAPVQNVHLGTPHAVQWGKVVGASIGRGPFRVAYKHYFLPTRFTDAAPPAIWRGADVLELKYVY
jgi:hypothetical protein